MGLGPSWYQIWNKTCYVPKVRNSYAEKGYLYQQAWKYHLWHVNVKIPWNWILKVFKSRNKIYQQMKLKVQMRKMGSFFLVIMFTPGVMIIKMLKMAHCLYFLLIIAKEVSHDLRKIFQRIWKILFTSLKNCYWIIDFWATFINPWKYRISVFLLTKQFLYTISHER